MNNINIAIVHDWLTGMRGGEKCLEVFCELFPEATVFTLIHNKGSVSPTIEKMRIETSFIQHFPGAANKYRTFLPFFPAAIESFDLSKYDLVLSSSHCAAKGAKAPENALHICYCHTPVRYAWKFFDEYFSKEKKIKKWLISQVVKNIKQWDLKTNKRIDHFVANSRNVKGRISEYYGREADVIYPPVDVDLHSSEGSASEDFYLIVSALVPYKRVDLAVEAFNATGKRLVIIGKGTDWDHLNSIAGDNVELLDWVSDEDLVSYYSRCKALIFPGEEDFGIVPVEAQAYGKPVIAYSAGGILETVIPLEENGKKVPTGVFFKEQTKESLNGAIDIFEAHEDKFLPDGIKENAMRFNRGRFKAEMKEYIENKWSEHSKNKGS